MNNQKIKISNSNFEEEFDIVDIKSYQELKRILDRFLSEKEEIKISSQDKNIILNKNNDYEMVQEEDLSLVWLFVEVLKGDYKYSGCKTN